MLRGYNGSEFPMLIREKLPSGRIYPQTTQAPINYFDFLNFFRGGQTIDDNLAAGAIASTLQANLLRAAISPSSTLGIEVWECGTCHHIQFFRANPRP